MSGNETADRIERVAALIDLRQFDRARQELVQLLAQEPHNADLWLKLTLVELGAGRDTAALAAVNNVLAHKTDSVAGLMVKADLLSRLSRNVEAIALLKRAVTLQPNNPSVHIDLAEKLCDSSVKKYQEALPHAERARELDPQNARAHLVFGMVLFELSSLSARFRFRESGGKLWPTVAVAKRSIRRAAELEPDNPDVLNALAFIDFTRYRNSRAINGFSRVLHISPQDEFAAECLAIAIRKHLVFLYRSVAVLSVLFYLLVAVPAAQTLIGHLVLTPLAVGAYHLVYQQIWRPFPRSMRSTVLFLLRRDVAVMPLFYGAAWMVGWTFTSVWLFWPRSPDSSLGIFTFFLAFIGYFLFLKAFRKKIEALSPQVVATQAESWASVARGDFNIS